MADAIPPDVSACCACNAAAPATASTAASILLLLLITQRACLPTRKPNPIPYRHRSPTARRTPPCPCALRLYGCAALSSGAHAWATPSTSSAHTDAFDARAEKGLAADRSRDLRRARAASLLLSSFASRRFRSSHTASNAAR